MLGIIVGRVRSDLYGFDDLIYGCNRFCTMGKENMNLGRLEDDKIIITNKNLKDEVCTPIQESTSGMLRLFIKS
jgi:hypothetical protein